MSSKLVKKLRIKPAMRIMLLNSPPGYEKALGALPDGVVVVSRPRRPVDLVQLFCRSMVDLKEGLPQAADHMKAGGVFWVCWPQQSAGVETDLNRDILWRVMLQAHYRPVASIAIDDTWSGLRFRAQA